MDGDKFNPDRYTPAGQRVLKEYLAAGVPFDVSTRPYYSTGRITFKKVNPSVLVVGPPATTQYLLVAEAGQKVVLFSYNQNGNMQAAGFPAGRAATLADTNLATPSETNNEDMVIEGFSATAKGVCGIIPSSLTSGMDSSVLATLSGYNSWFDPGAHVQGPEVASPLALQETLWELIKPKVSVRTLWDLKDTDNLGVLSEFPEGGGKAYLRANGEPSTSNILRIPEGYVWRRTNDTRDKLFTLTLTLEEPAVCLITETPTYAPIAPENPLIPSAYAIDFMVRAHGTAFYNPSTN